MVDTEVDSCYNNPYNQNHFQNSDTSVERNYSKVKLYPTFLWTFNAASIQSEVFPITFQVRTVKMSIFSASKLMIRGSLLFLIVE
jgi:hypothetical protein